MPSSYVVGEHFEAFIKNQIQQGRYRTRLSRIDSSCKSGVARRGIGTRRDQSAAVSASRGDAEPAGKSNSGRLPSNRSVFVESKNAACRCHCPQVCSMPDQPSGMNFCQASSPCLAVAAVRCARWHRASGTQRLDAACRMRIIYAH